MRSGFLLRLLRDFGLLADPIKKVRRENPSCSIANGVSLNEVELGKYVSVLRGASVTQSQIGDHSYIGINCSLQNITLGKYCSIAPGVIIGLARHPTKDFVSTYPAFYSADNGGCARQFRHDKIFNDNPPETTIGHDVWIGTNAMIPGGVNIGCGAIIAAGSVVAKDIKPYSIVGGNPASLIRYRFEKDEIVQLLESKWWDWPAEDIDKNVDSFSDISSFVKLIKARE